MLSLMGSLKSVEQFIPLLSFLYSGFSFLTLAIIVCVTGLSTKIEGLKKVMYYNYIHSVGFLLFSFGRRGLRINSLTMGNAMYFAIVQLTSSSLSLWLFLSVL